MQLNLFKAGLSAEFQSCDINDSYFLQEYLNININSRLNKWKKLASKVDFEESEKLIFELLLSLKEDIARLQNNLSEQDKLLPLSQKGIIDALNFEYLNFLEPLLEKDKQYYMRFEINNQKIALFIEAQSENLAKMIKIKPEDRIIYDAFVVEIQRDMIRSKKGD
ncbi:hypothetical protein [Campylobacter cuniculorum]|uniref:Uncharacterized protein n=2 Tax=Campylobacter cuniculorum TaxID=374106 RepID=A0A1W6BUU8_9BACT|nr:hypothetical protein [Campylobacter cuniculorum]ARJ55873.1 hypothetical protein CCUN_0217 [Campylobacter cuniculorum DSM 23162 = LMG 24588]QOR05089.1 hypothetical protein A0071_03950 [Campylobacter cuniculorum]